MKFPLAAILVVLVAAGKNPDNPEQAQSIYEFFANDIRGNEVSMEKYRGHPLIIVNVASKCDLTENSYKHLNELYERYYKKGLRILAFPCNQFKHQEPGSDAEILQFVTNRGVKFDMFSKIDVNGPNAHPIYKYLKAKVPGEDGDTIKWNFAKFIVDRNGQPVERLSPYTDPLNMVASIEKYL